MKIETKEGRKPVWRLTAWPLPALLFVAALCFWSCPASAKDRKNNNLAYVCDDGAPIPCPQYIELSATDAGRGQANGTITINGSGFESGTISANAIYLDNCANHTFPVTVPLYHSDITITAGSGSTYSGTLNQVNLRLPTQGEMTSGGALQTWWGGPGGNDPNDTTQDGYCDMVIPLGGRQYRFPYTYMRDRKAPVVTNHFKLSQPIGTPGGNITFRYIFRDPETPTLDPDGTTCTNGSDGDDCNQTAQFMEVRVFDDNDQAVPMIVSTSATKATTSRSFSSANRSPQYCPMFVVRDKATNASSFYRPSQLCSGYGSAGACNADANCYWDGAPFNACFDKFCFSPDGLNPSYTVQYYFQYNPVTGVFSDPLPTATDGVPIVNQNESRSSEPAPDKIIHLKITPSEPLWDCTPDTTDARFGYGQTFFMYARKNYMVVPGDGLDNDKDGSTDEEANGFNDIDDDDDMGDGSGVGFAPDLVDEDITGNLDYCQRKTCQTNQVYDYVTQTCFWKYPMIKINGPDPDVYVENARIELISTTPLVYHYAVNVAQADVEYDFEVLFKAQDAVGNPDISTLDYVVASTGGTLRIDNTPSTYQAFYYNDEAMTQQLSKTVPTGMPGSIDCDGLDNDGDGAIDEEIFDNKNNDYDTRVDEDYCSTRPITRTNPIYVKIVASDKQVGSPTVRITRPGTHGTVTLGAVPINGSDTEFLANWNVTEHSNHADPRANPYDTTQEYADGIASVLVSGTDVAGNPSGFVAPETTSSSFPGFRIDTAPPRIYGDDICYWDTSGSSCGYFCGQYTSESQCGEASNCAWDSGANKCYSGCAAQYVTCSSAYTDQTSCNADCQCRWTGTACATKCSAYPEQNSCEGLKYAYPGYGAIAYDDYGHPTSNPRLRWTMTDPDCVKFQIQIDDEATFSTPLRDTQVTTQYYSPSTLDQGTYYWQLKATDILGNYSNYKVECSPKDPTVCTFVINTDIPLFTVTLYSDSAMTTLVPTDSNGVRLVKEFGGSGPEDYLYIKIASSKVLQAAPTFSLGQQGTNDLTDQPTASLGSNQYFAKVTIGIDNGSTNRDGLAYITVSGTDSAGNSVDDAIPVEGTGTFKIDTQPPSASQFRFTPDPAKMGANTISLMSNEQLRTPIQAVATIACLYSGSGVAVSLTQPVTSQFSYSGTYTVSEHQDCEGGTITATIYDVVGHSTNINTTFDVDTAPSGVPELTNPANIPDGSPPSSTRNPIFSWSMPPDSDAVRYHLQLAQDVDFTKMIKETAEIATLSYSVGDPMCIENNITPSCRQPGQSCAAPSDCCGAGYGAACTGNICVAPTACMLTGSSCVEDVDCCGYDTGAGSCVRTPLPDDEYWWHVSAIDDQENESVYSETRRYSIDTTPPSPPVFSSLRKMDGVALTSNKTSDEFLVFNVNASTDGVPDQSAPVVFFVNGEAQDAQDWVDAGESYECRTRTSPVVTDASGNAQNLCLLLTAGSNIITGQVTDWAGNLGTVGGNTTVEYDSGAPTFEIHYYLDNPNIVENPPGVGTNSQGIPMASAGTIYLKIISNKPIKASTTPKFSIEQGGTSDTMNVTSSAIDGDESRRRFWGSYQVHAQDGTQYIDGDTSVTISAEDEIGNKCGGGGSQADCEITAGDKFVIDTAVSNVQVDYYTDSNLITRLRQGTDLVRVSKAGTIYLKFMFTEELSSTPTFSMDQPGSTDVEDQPTTSVNGSKSVFSGSYTVNAASGDSYVDGIASVLVDAVDVAGNTATNLAPITGGQFRIDTTPPAAPALITQLLETPYNQVSIYGTTEPYASITIFVKYSPASATECKSYNQTQCAIYQFCMWNTDESKCEADPPTLSWSGTADDHGAYSIYVILGPATNTVWGQVTDVAGNVSTTSAPFEILNTALISTNYSFYLTELGWQLISIPFMPSQANPTTGLGIPNAIFSMSTDTPAYSNRYKYSSKVDPLTPGRGFWLNVTQAPVSRVLSVYQSTAFMVSLTEGWNIFGVPYQQEISWDADNVLVSSPEESGTSYGIGTDQAEDLVQGRIYRYEPSGQTLQEQWVQIDPDTGYKLVPFKGYMIRAFGDVNLIFPPAPED